MKEYRLRDGAERPANLLHSKDCLASVRIIGGSRIAGQIVRGGDAAMSKE